MCETAKGRAPNEQPDVGMVRAYLQAVGSAGKIRDSNRLEQVSAFHGQFKEDIRTQDKAQGMIAKMIGGEKARRIFYEVTT